MGTFSLWFNSETYPISTPSRALLKAPLAERLSHYLVKVLPVSWWRALVLSGM
jgi:hypothetical protein